MLRRLAAFALAISLLGAAPPPKDQLVMFAQRGCPYCAAWDRDIGPGYQKSDEGHEFPLRRVDIASERPADLREIKNIVATPTFVLMHCGREFRRITGYIGPDQFWGLLDIAVKALHEEERASGAGCTW